MTKSDLPCRIFFTITAGKQDIDLGERGVLQLRLQNLYLTTAETVFKRKCSPLVFGVDLDGVLSVGKGIRKHMAIEYEFPLAENARFLATLAKFLQGGQRSNVAGSSLKKIRAVLQVHRATCRDVYVTYNAFTGNLRINFS